MKNLAKKIEWKTAFKTALSASITLFLCLAINSYLKLTDGSISALWAMVASIVVQQTHLGTTYKTAWNRFLGVFIGSFMGAFFTIYLGSSPSSVGLGIFLTIIICSIFNLKDSVRIACLSVAVVMTLWGIRSEINPWFFAFHRFIDSCLGILVAVVIAHMIWPLHVSKKLAALMSDAFQNIVKLYDHTATPDLLSELQMANIKILSNETYDLIWTSRQLIEDSKLELLSALPSLEEWKFFLNHLENMLDRIAVLSKSYKQNLTTLLDPGLSESLLELIKTTNYYINELSKAIEKFKPLPNSQKILESLENLNDEMLRFRNTKKTGQFKLEDVEGFYVFFYSIRLFTDEVVKARDHMENIITEATS